MFSSIGRVRDPERWFRRFLLVLLAWGAAWIVAALAAWIAWLVLLFRLGRAMLAFLWTLLFATPPASLVDPLTEAPAEVFEVDLVVHELDPRWEEPGGDEILDEGDFARDVAAWEAEQRRLEEERRARERREAERVGVLALLTSDALFESHIQTLDLVSVGVGEGGAPTSSGLVGGTLGSRGTGSGGGGAGGLGTGGLANRGRGGDVSGGFGAYGAVASASWHVVVDTVGGTFPADVARARLTGATADLEECLATAPIVASGRHRIEVDVEVRADGSVASRSATGTAGTEALACIELALSAIPWGPPPDGPATVDAALRATPR